MKPIVIDSIDGKIIFTKDKFTKLIEDVYNEGFSDGQKSITSITTYPVYHSTPINPNWSNNLYKTLFTTDNTENTDKSLTGRPIK